MIDYKDFSKVANTLESCKWIFAKTMPDNPHWYTLRKDFGNEKDFELLVQYIRDFGAREKYGKTWYKKLDINGFKYWSMGAPLGETILINKAVSQYDCNYDSVAGVYDSLYQDKESKDEDYIVQSIISGYIEGKSVLDIGCGTGLLYSMIGSQCQYTGIDISAKMIEVFSAKYPQAKAIKTTFEAYSSRGRHDIAISLFGGISHVKPEYVRKVNDLADKYFLMFYSPGYNLKLEAETGFSFPHYEDGLSVLDGDRIKIGGFTAVSNL
jgi:hypothetical protein